MEDQFDLVIDIGNTRTKVGWFKTGRCFRSASMDRFDIQNLNKLLNGHRPAGIALGSVGAITAPELEELGKIAPLLEINGGTPLPIKNAYSTPGTLGVDRIANAVGAWRFFPGRPVLIIDLGTCITYDLVEAEGIFVGGAISPGRRMRALAMHAYSARLPMVEPGEEVDLIGSSTVDALCSGIHHGLVNELRGMIASFGHQRHDLVVMLTGGDALSAARALKSGIFAHPLLTLEGLHAILVHNRDPHSFGGSADLSGGTGSGTTR